MGIDSEGNSTRAVSYSEAMGVPPVWYAMNKICGDVGMLPIDVKRIRGDGAENDLRHDGYRLLREQPNQIQSPSVFKEQVTGHALLWGNGRAAIIREGERITELIPMMPDRTWTVIVEGQKYHITKPDKHDDRNLFDLFDVDDNGYLVFHDRDVLHIPAFNFNGVEGMGLLELANKTFGVGAEAQNHTYNQLKQGFRGKLFLHEPHGAFAKDSDARQFINEFNAKESGSQNAGKAGLLRNGIKAEALNMSNNESQFVDLQKYNRQDVGLLFGIDSMPGDGESVSYNSLEQKNLQYLTALDKWLVKWEEQCDMKLRTGTQIRLRSHYFKFNRGAILRTDLATTMEAFTKGIASRILNPNECRAKLDMNPYKGGDEYINPAITQSGEKPAEPTEHDEDEQDESEEETQATERRAIDATIRSLMTREANNAISGCKAKNFIDWIEANYAKWEPKLADKLEELGIDRDKARTHCEQSRQELLRAADNSTMETLLANVTAIVATWKNRNFNEGQ
jgi:HK97 family phage portal protein